MKLRSLLPLAVLAAALATVRADEVTDALNEARTAYEAGDFSAAIQSLDYASSLIRQKSAGVLERALPAPLAGWEADSADNTAAGAAMFGGMTQSQRQYRQGDKSVTVSIQKDSPLLQMAMAYLANPALAGPNSRQARIGGQRAMIKYERDDRSGEIQIVVAGTTFVQIQGYGVDEADLTAYANGVNFGLLQQ